MESIYFASIKSSVRLLAFEDDNEPRYSFGVMDLFIFAKNIRTELSKALFCVLVREPVELAELDALNKLIAVAMADEAGILLMSFGVKALATCINEFVFVIVSTVLDASREAPLFKTKAGGKLAGDNELVDTPEASNVLYGNDCIIAESPFDNIVSS